MRLSSVSGKLEQRVIEQRVNGCRIIKFCSEYTTNLAGPHLFPSKSRQFTPKQRAALKALARQTTDPPETDQPETEHGITAQEEEETEQSQNALEVSEMRYRRLFETAREVTRTGSSILGITAEQYQE